ncbi:ATP-binding protein, partial [Cryobacterium sp. 5B3]|uniref:ATP-binding protein n=1 Tax=Cryobacterium sp. 5B3 TaxID=3048586 RepID=UPI002B233B6D
RPTPHRGCGTQSRNERMGTSVRWGDVFGDQVVAAAMIDRIVHHADVISLKGASYRLKDSGITTLPSARPENTVE